MPFDLKIQSIQPDFSPGDNTISISHDFSKPDGELEKLGRLFMVISITNAKSFDLESIVKVLSDHIYEEYYKHNDHTPLKNLENALKSGLDFLLSIKSPDDKEYLLKAEDKPNLCISLALIWNNVLYTVNIGTTPIYIVRGAGTLYINEDETPNDLETYTNATVLESEDLVILGTEEFAKHFPPKDILNNISSLPTKISGLPSRASIALMLIKLISTSTNISKQRDRFLNTMIFTNIFAIFSHMRERFNPYGSLSEEFKPYQSKKSAPISTISGIAEPQMLKKDRSKPRRANNPQKNTKLKMTIGLLVVVFMAVGGIFLYKNAISQQTPRDTLSNLRLADSTETQESEDLETSDTTSNGPLKVAPIFTFNEEKGYGGLEVTLFGVYNKENLVIYSRPDNSIFYYEKSKNTLKEIISEVDNVEQIKCYVRFCIFYGNNIVQLFDPATPEKIDKYPVDNSYVIFDIDYYSDRIYVLSSDSILSFKMGETNPQITPWLKESIKLVNPASMTTDSDIYVIDELILKKFSSGNQMNFSLKPNSGVNPARAFSDTRYLYIFDQVQSAIRTYRKTGDMIKEVMLFDKVISQNIEPQDIYITPETTATQPNLFLQIDNVVYYLSTAAL